MFLRGELRLTGEPYERLTINDAEEEWTNIAKAIHEIATEVIGTNRKIREEIWFENMDRKGSTKKKREMHIKMHSNLQKKKKTGKAHQEERELRNNAPCRQTTAFKIAK